MFDKAMFEKRTLNNLISVAAKHKRRCIDLSTPIDNGSTKKYKVDTVLPTDEDNLKDGCFEETSLLPSSERTKTEDNFYPKRGKELVTNQYWIQRKIIVPVERHPMYDYGGLIIGPRGSTIKTLVTEAGGNLRIKVKGEGVSRGSKEPLHVLLEGEPACVGRAELLIDDLLQIPDRERSDTITCNGDVKYSSFIHRTFEESVKRHRKDDIVSRKIFIPVEHFKDRSYVRLLIGLGGSRIKALEAETCGKVNITVCDEKNPGKGHNEPPYVWLEGEPFFVDKAEFLISNMLKGHSIEWQRSERISRKIFLPVGRNPDIDYIGIFLASGASTINALQTESGAEISLRGKGRTDFNGSDEPLHLLIEGDPSCVHKAEHLIHDFMQNAEQKKSNFERARHFIEQDVKNEDSKMHKLEDMVSRKIIIIPPEFCPERKYVDLLIGPNGSKHKALIAKAGGKARIVVHDGKAEDCICENYERIPHVLIQGERQSVDKAESLVNKLFLLPRNNDNNDNMPLFESNKTNLHNKSRSLIDRVCALENIVGVNFNSDETISRKVILLENETFGNARKGTLTERISELEKVLG